MVPDTDETEGTQEASATEAVTDETTTTDTLTNAGDGGTVVVSDQE